MKEEEQNLYLIFWGTGDHPQIISAPSDKMAMTLAQDKAMKKLRSHAFKEGLVNLYVEWLDYAAENDPPDFFVRRLKEKWFTRLIQQSDLIHY